jgi:superfamily I DNA and/or RNA helicase
MHEKDVVINSCARNTDDGGDRGDQKTPFR